MMRPITIAEKQDYMQKHKLELQKSKLVNKNVKVAKNEQISFNTPIKKFNVSINISHENTIDHCKIA